MELTKRITGIASVGLLGVGLLAGCATDSDQDAGASDAPTSSNQASQGAPETSETVDEMPDENADLRETAFPVSAQDAIDTATEETGDGTVHAIELDYDSDKDSWVYSVKVLTEASGQDNDDHKVLIDPVSGDVTDQETESTSDQEEAIDLEAPMTYDEALDTATGEVDDALRGWKYEWDDGQLEYQFDLGPTEDTTEVTVLADSGDVRTD